MLPEIVVFEGKNVDKYLSIAINRPLFDIFAGTMTFLKKIELVNQNKFPVSLFVRDYLKDFTSFTHPEYKVNIVPSSNTIFLINSCLSFNENLFDIIQKLQLNSVIKSNEEIICGFIETKHFENIMTGNFSDISIVDSEIKIIDSIWELIAQNGNLIKDDYKYLSRILDNSIEIFPQDEYITSANFPMVVFNALDGPVLIEKTAKIEPFSLIKGPAYIGEKVFIKSGTLIDRNTSIFKNAKVGGEIENSIIFPFSNKQHDGFLGHSCIGSWVNLGAGTISSDLKNNYGHIRVKFNQQEHNTGLRFLGTIIGDHSKTAINTRLNTGTVIGIFANLFGNTFEYKTFENYVWGDNSTNEIFEFNKATEMAKIMMTRRNMEMSQEEQDLYYYYYQKTSKNV